jgi:hypothetical protein
MKKAITTLAAAAALAMTTVANADGRQYDYSGAGRYTVQPAVAPMHPLAGLRDIDIRQARQRERIEMGLNRGAIKRGEYRRLMAEQHDIQALERAFVADGRLTPREHTELTRRLDVAAANIRLEARDHQRRF